MVRRSRPIFRYLNIIKQLRPDRYSFDCSAQNNGRKPGIRFFKDFQTRGFTYGGQNNEGKTITQIRQPIAAYHSRRTLRRRKETVGIDHARVWRRTLRRPNETVGTHYARASRRTLRRQNETVGTHYALVLRRTLRRQNETVGTYYARDTTSAKGDGRDALRTGVAEDTAPAK